MWFLPLVNCRGFPDPIVCNQRVLQDLSLHIEGGGSNFLTFMFCLIMWLKMLLRKKILSAQYTWALGFSMRWIFIRLCYANNSMWRLHKDGMYWYQRPCVCCPLQWVDGSIIAQDCLTGEISLWLLQDKLPTLLGDTPWPDEIICMSSKAAVPPNFSCAVTVHHGIPQADGLVMVGYNLAIQLSRLKHLNFVCEDGWSSWYAREVCKQEVHFVIACLMLHLDKLMLVMYRWAAVFIEAKVHI
jgi:hypothetical protein